MMIKVVIVKMVVRVVAPKVVAEIVLVAAQISVMAVGDNVNIVHGIEPNMRTWLIQKPSPHNNKIT